MSNKFDLDSHVAKHQHTPQVDHSGKHRQVPTAPGMEGRTHINEHDAAHGTTPGKPKHLSGNVPLHGGMSEQSRKMNGVGGLGHATSIDQVPVANPGTNPISKEPLGKTYATPKNSWGAKSHTLAGANMGPDDLKKLGDAIKREATFNK
jgi:hypothetical protein